MTINVVLKANRVAEFFTFESFESYIFEFVVWHSLYQYSICHRKKVNHMNKMLTHTVNQAYNCHFFFFEKRNYVVCFYFKTLILIPEHGGLRKMLNIFGKLQPG